MSEKMEPALSPEEWTERRVRFVGVPDLMFHDDGDGLELVVWAGDRVWEKLKFNQAPNVDLPALIALANAGLPDSDPRKITHEKIEWMRLAAENEPDWREGGWLRAWADALESYLPPTDG